MSYGIKRDDCFIIMFMASLYFFTETGENQQAADTSTPSMTKEKMTFLHPSKLNTSRVLQCPKQPVDFSHLWQEKKRLRYVWSSFAVQSCRENHCVIMSKYNYCRGMFPPPPPHTGEICCKAWLCAVHGHRAMESAAVFNHFSFLGLHWCRYV